MTVSHFARTAFVAAATGAVLLSGLTAAGAAGAGEPVEKTRKSLVTSETSVLKSPQVLVPHGRKIG